MELPYDEKDISSIFNYSRRLVNKCLRDFTDTTHEYKGKGGLGQLVEKVLFKYDLNNRQEADFSYIGTELKCTPLKTTGKTNELHIKERLVCSMINYTKDWDKPFDKSHFYQKCLTMLILFYLHEKGISKLDLKFLFIVLWRIPEKDLLIIRQDYDVIINKIRNGMAHTLSEGDTMYLGACRKGSKGDSLMEQHNSTIGAPRRAWSLKTAYMHTVLEEVKQYNKDGAYCNYEPFAHTKKGLFSIEELRHSSIEDIITARFAPYIGKTYSEICDLLALNRTAAKSKYFVITNAIAGHNKTGNINRSEEFTKAGIIVKTIRLNKNGNIKESMSFENIDYQEIADCNEWTESRLYEIFTSRFMLVVYKETDSVLTLSESGKRQEPEYALHKVFFWTMPQTDLCIAEEYWENIRQCVLTNHISPEYFWSIKDNRNFHVRPKAQVANDMTANPNGGEARKYCYWFNNKYIKKIVANELQPE